MPTRSVRLRVLVTLGAGMAIGAVATMVVRGTAPADPVIDTAPPAPTSSTSVPAVGPGELAAFRAYLDAVRPIIQEAGRVVQQGMKPAVTQLQDPEGNHEGVAADASGWLGAITQAQEDWAAITPPPALQDAHQLFLRAMTHYREAAHHLAEAASDGEQREALTMRVTELGTQADRIYDEASALVRAHLNAGGDDPGPWLPPRD